jgi:hypothetical protein
MNDEALIDEMVQRLGCELKGILGSVEEGGLSAGALEGVIRESLWHVGAQALGVLLEAMDRRLARGKVVHDHRTRTMVSLFGPLDISRSRCEEDGGRFCPLDEAIGLVGHRGWTVGVQEAVSLLSCESGFETTADLMKRLFGLSISAPTVQTLAEEAGRRAEALLAAEQAHPDVPADRPTPETLIVATDGCQAPQRDGWHEVKVATIYPKRSRCRTASGRGKLLDKEYYATLENAEGFGQALWARAQRWSVASARRVVVMGDGAAWIWTMSDLRFPGALEIVDFYHAAEHLWELGEALWGDRHTCSATRSWVRRYRKRLRQGRVDLLLAAIDRSVDQQRRVLSGPRRDVVRRNRNYFATNADRMRYSRFRQMGLPIGTGAVEGSCKYVVQSRFKRPGSRWSRPGLQSMLALKLMRLNNRWETLWPHLTAA